MEQTFHWTISSQKQKGWIVTWLNFEWYKPKNKNNNKINEQKQNRIKLDFASMGKNCTSITILLIIIFLWCMLALILLYCCRLMFREGDYWLFVHHSASAEWIGTGLRKRRIGTTIRYNSSHVRCDCAEYFFMYWFQ